tara:strand:+ start:135 stop:335 length:201 start_codon:yes stop_codon:yes gene_type:complete
MNCCDDYGNCLQGRDCAVRRGLPQDGWQLDDPDGMSAVEMLTMVCIYLVFVLAMSFFLGIIVGYIG